MPSAGHNDIESPAPGDERRGAEIGRTQRAIFKWWPCETCGTCRWVRRNMLDAHRFCRACRATHTGAKLRGRRREGTRTSRITASGYRAIKPPDDWKWPEMVQADGWILEHRVVMALVLGRPLSRTENVHHINGRRTDNRRANLELWRVSQPTGVRAEQAPHCPTCTCGG
jgi:hypothetical protein